MYYGLALFLGEKFKATLLNTFYIPYSSADVSSSMSDVTSENADKLFAQLLDDIKDGFPDQEFDIETMFSVGDLNAMSSLIIKKKKVDLVVMGTHGNRGATGLEKLIGSRTSGMIRSVPCSILAIPDNCRFEPPSKIVLALEDEDDVNWKVLQPLLEIAQKFKSRILILHVIKDHKRDEPLESDELEDYLKNTDHSFHIVYNDDVLEAINDFIEEQNASMLAMVIPKLNLFERIFHRSLTKKMSLHTEIPLLTLQATH